MNTHSIRGANAVDYRCSTMCILYVSICMDNTLHQCTVSGAMPIESYITQKVMVVSEKTNGTAVCNTVAVVILIVMPVSVGAMLKENGVSTNPHLCMCSQIFVIVNKKNM